jgi:DNA repair protein RecO (recombination protein O)
MNENARGLVLRTRLLTDTSLIVHWLTPTLGRLATVAKGARRAKSAFRGKLDLFYVAEFSFKRSRRSELHTLCELSLEATHSGLRQELGYLQQASYAAELVEQTTEVETPLPEVYELMRTFLEALPRQAPQARTMLAFELKLMSVLGMEPDVGASRLSLPAKETVKALVSESWASIPRLRPTSAQASEVHRFIEDFLRFHLNRIPAGRPGAIRV